MMPRQNGFHGPAFTATRGKAQGGLLPLKLFSLVVDNFIRTWLAMTLKEQRVAHDWFGETVGRCLGVFYANDDKAVSRHPDWLQHSMNVLVSLFQRYVLAANAAKSRTMTCQPRIIWLGVSKESKALKYTGVGDS